MRGLRYLIVMFLLASSMMVGMSSCDYTLARNPKVLVEKIAMDPTTLNPFMVREMSSHIITYYLFDSLLEYDDETLELEPGLAKRWEVSPDHLSYTFWIEEGATWHDGKPLTIDDVIFTFEAAQDKRVDAATIRNYFKDFVKVERVGENAARFFFSKPYFKAESVIGLVKILPKHIFKDLDTFNTNPANMNPVGSGPFKFVKWSRGERVELARNDNYFGKKPGVEGLAFRIIPNKVTAFQLLKKGAIDKAKISLTQTMYQTDDPAFKDKFTKHEFYPPNNTLLGWNSKRALFSDRRVRVAMSMLIDRKKILDKLFYGKGEVITGPFYRFGLNYDERIKPYPYDPEGAIKLLEEAGWVDIDGDGVREKDGVPFKFSVLFRSGEKFSRTVTSYLREELARVGIEMELMQMEWGAMIGRLINRDFDAISLGFSIPLVEDPYTSWHSSQLGKGINYFGFDNAHADELLEKARGEFDSKKRAAIYGEFQKILHYEQPCTYLYVLSDNMAIARRFKNVIDYKIGPNIEDWKVGPWPILKEW
ncbi:MAG: hypothetical protein HN337_01055 [Deltaproteobacteria bacterium]|nr:hypothetical protein [Deltaproteobacteria bacterium]